MPGKPRLGLIPVIVVTVLSACAMDGDGFRREGAVNPPSQLAVEPRAVPRGQTLTWGGVIISVDNLAERTVLEVLAYPLDDQGRPNTGAAPQGRFLGDYAGYLEPKDYAPGRQVSLTGDLLGYQDGKIGAANYRFPAVAIKRLRLWDQADGGRWDRPRIGVGVNAGSHGGGIGIGVGF